jgi:rhodanese-related sulfurtransferase
VVLGLGVNLISSNRIDYIGKFRDLSGGDGPIVPPETQEGDPAFIDMNVAQLEYNTGAALFVDSRDREQFECGTIPGSVNIPFEYLPEGDLEPYFDSVLAGVPHDHHIIVFCSGEECDLSLHLGRNLQAHGYKRVSVFYGGSREWERFGFEVERRRECGQ